MKDRFLTSLGVTGLAIALVAVLLAPLTVTGQAQRSTTAAAARPASAKPWTMPRTPEGRPDLQGYWTNNTYTPLERPQNVTKEFYTKEEAEAAAKTRAEREAEQTEPGTTADVHYDFTQFGLDRSQTRLTVNLRTSIIVDPPNGRIPAVTAEGQRRATERAAQRKAQGATYDQVQNIAMGSRCVWSNAGPPMLPPGYNPAYQIVQGPDFVMILIENQHEVRIIPTDARPHAPQGVRSFLGDSRGRWEGDTLVVETTNFNDKTAFRGASENMKVTERFTRVSDDEIRYQFTVHDPSTWEVPWTGEMPYVKINGPIFEHACHEGNYGITNTLAGVRLEEKRAAEQAAKGGR
jgi:cell division septation protein DedD